MFIDSYNSTEIPSGRPHWRKANPPKASLVATYKYPNKQAAATTESIVSKPPVKRENPGIYACIYFRQGEPPAILGL